MGSEKRFGFEWHKYRQLDPNYQIQFRGWIKPFGPEIFKDKKILDAGCGMGRNSFWALKYGAKELVAFDYDQRSVAAAKKNLAGFNHARVEFKSIYEIDYQDEFDVAFCIGVIHHLENPDSAIKNLIRALKPGGLLLIWVYGYKNNEWIVRWVSPIRRAITSQLPPALLHLITYCLSAPFYLFVKIIPQKSPYFKQVGQFKFSHLHSIIFDQLLPKIANYYKKEEAFNLLKRHNLDNININHTNDNSWTIYGTKP